MRLILASQSQRRRELFELIGLDFSVVVSDADENMELDEPGKYVEALSLRKAEAVKRSHPGCCVVGSDTIVWLDGRVIGKPADSDDAFRILRSLSGRTHTVYTGIAVLTDNTADVAHETALVTFDELSDRDIWAYIRTGEPLDKAGAYGIQGIGAVLIKKVEGCYFTVIGMPVNRLRHMLQKVGIAPRWLNGGS